MIGRSDGSRKRAASRNTRSGSCRVDTFLPSAPSPARSVRAMSRIQTNSPVARNRCPAASGEVMARMWMSARSRTSTTSRPIRGVPGMLPRTIRAMIPTEPMLLVLRIGPNGARQYGGQRGQTFVAGHILPGRLLRKRLGPSVGDECRVVRIGPQGLVGDPLVGVGRRAGGVRRRRDHNSLDAGRDRRSEDPEGAVPRGYDQLVGVG